MEELIEPSRDEATAESYDELAVLPVKGLILYPNLPAPLAVGKSRSIKLVNDALSMDKHIAIVGIKAEALGKDDPRPQDLYPVGTIAQIHKMVKFQENYYQIIVQGLNRVKLKEYTQTEPFLKAKIEFLEEDRTVDKEVEAILINVRKLFERYVELEKVNFQIDLFTAQEQHPADVGYFIAANVNLELKKQQELLETLALKERLRKLFVFLNEGLETLELSKEIQEKMKEGIEKTQREVLLREQLKTIQKELGMDSSQSPEIGEFRDRIERAHLPEEALQAAGNELDRLSKMSPATAEYMVSRTYLEWILDLPWQHSTEDNLDMERAQRILDEDHYGLKKIKRRILEYLAVRKLKKDMRGPVLCFVGPPGVGKTSLGRSIARSLGRKVARISLGGIRDEAEIRGHRRTYVGALPGRIIQGMKKGGSNNPVFILDEIDKIGMDFRGDPSSALLEVLDPEQNSFFSDHYLEIPFDLSKVMFITTANLIDPILPALKDRLEIIELPGYIDEEKLLIAKHHLVPREIKEHGLTPERIHFNDGALKEIIRFYTREAGVRNLQREIASVCRGVARKIASQKTNHVQVDKEIVYKILGPKKYLPESEVRNWGPGLSTGLAWTPTGGELIFVEASKMKGGKNLILTGQLGEVMKESATAALSYIRAHTEEISLESDFYRDIDIHIHVPAGAIPKDGPSAGVAIFCALASLLTGSPVRRDIAMTGEITLRGDVLPVGGIKEKVLAAKRAGLTTVILPKMNEKDLEDIPKHIIKGLVFAFVHQMDEVLDIAIPLARKDTKEESNLPFRETFRYVTQNLQN